MMLRYLLVFCSLAVFDVAAMAQQPVLENKVWDDQIKTVQLYKKGFELSYPFLELGNPDQLVLSFDDLSGEPFDLSYTFVHCNADWRPSTLVKTEYMQGSLTELVQAGRQSFGTLVPYIHYEVQFPNQYMTFSRSGNYIVKIHLTGSEDEVLLTRRFVVFQNKVNINARIVAARDVASRNEVQQLELSVAHPGVNVQDPFSDLKVVAMQNMRWEDARDGMKPMFIRAEEIVYDRPLEAAFMGLNEWRRFDVKDLSFVTQEVRQVLRTGESFEVLLQPDVKRNISVYLEEPDINGRFLVRNDQAWEQALGAEYVYVTFTLPMEAPVGPGHVYVYGGLSEMGFREEFKMKWMPDQKAYYLRTILKQGYYNYMYAYKNPSKDAKPDLARIEGTHNQAENQYQVLVYLRNMQNNVDELLGVRFFNSRSDR